MLGIVNVFTVLQIIELVISILNERTNTQARVYFVLYAFCRQFIYLYKVIKSRHK